MTQFEVLNKFTTEFCELCGLKYEGETREDLASCLMGLAGAVKVGCHIKVHDPVLFKRTLDEMELGMATGKMMTDLEENNELSEKST